MKNISKKLLAAILIVGSILTGCSVNKANIDESLQPFFDNRGVKGCFTMLNNADGSITVYNIGMDTMRVSPLSTFEIMGALVGLQTGAATSEKMVMGLDSLVCEGNDTCKNMNMAEAFQSGCGAYFQQLAQITGKERLQYWIDSIGYGNKKLTDPIDSSWMNGTLAISPDEQLGLMKRLYFDQLPFRKTVQETVRQLMLQEDNSAYRLSYKTGHGVDARQQPISWICGWIEENKHVYFFVTLLQTDKPGKMEQDMASLISRDILGHYGFFKGKK